MKKAYYITKFFIEALVETIKLFREENKKFKQVYKQLKIDGVIVDNLKGYIRRRRLANKYGCVFYHKQLEAFEQLNEPKN